MNPNNIEVSVKFEADNHVISGLFNVPQGLDFKQEPLSSFGSTSSGVEILDILHTFSERRISILQEIERRGLEIHYKDILQSRQIVLSDWFDTIPFEKFSEFLKKVEIAVNNTPKETLDLKSAMFAIFTQNWTKHTNNLSDYLGEFAEDFGSSSAQVSINFKHELHRSSNGVGGSFNGKIEFPIDFGIETGFSEKMRIACEKTWLKLEKGTTNIARKVISSIFGQLHTPTYRMSRELLTIYQELEHYIMTKENGKLSDVRPEIADLEKEIIEIFLNNRKNIESIQKTGLSLGSSSLGLQSACASFGVTPGAPLPSCEEVKHLPRNNLFIRYKTAEGKIEESKPKITDINKIKEYVLRFNRRINIYIYMQNFMTNLIAEFNSNEVKNISTLAEVVESCVQKLIDYIVDLYVADNKYMSNDVL
jgi:hypothetical protein